MRRPPAKPDQRSHRGRQLTRCRVNQNFKRARWPATRSRRERKGGSCWPRPLSSTRGLVVVGRRSRGRPSRLTCPSSGPFRSTVGSLRCFPAALLMWCWRTMFTTAGRPMPAVGCSCGWTDRDRAERATEQDTRRLRATVCAWQRACVNVSRASREALTKWKKDGSCLAFFGFSFFVNHMIMCVGFRMSSSVAGRCFAGRATQESH